MPPQRIPLRQTNLFRLQIAEAFRTAPCGSRYAHSRETAATVLSWVDKIDKLRETERLGVVTLGGSGCKCETLEHEDSLSVRIKDLLRERYVVTRAMIVFMAQETVPQFFEEKTTNAAMCWCARFMKRIRLILRRVNTRGRETRESLF
ncbi:hypothetical protein F444_04177 [Phytophthora nicotianae P1976]|uniref:HTH CENPB-type domain-containing protein n=1 Tax=Phytophthora nicotianae P1976 TaxID=1317066 RepID=A0A081ARP5_PHYNI|nr:hypothetical protein F444_04177 [Phytophthora nicotianae P1976]